MWNEKGELWRKQSSWFMVDFEILKGDLSKSKCQDKNWLKIQYKLKNNNK